MNAQEENAESEGVKKVAIKKEGYLPILYALDQKQPLIDVVKEVCVRWNIDHPERYFLQDSDTKFYITQESRAELRDGRILTLNFSPEHAADTYKQAILLSNLEEKKAALQNLAGQLDAQGQTEVTGQAEDPTLAKHFIKIKGLDVLIKMVEIGDDNMEILLYTLVAFQELMEHGLLPWDNIVSNKFVKKVAGYVNQSSSTDPKVLHRSLSLLENIVMNSPKMQNTVAHEVSVDNVSNLMKSTNPDIQLSAVSLSNALFLKAPAEKKGMVAIHLREKGLRKVLLNIILNSNHIGSDMAHQLYVFQSLMLNLHENRMNLSADINDSTLKEELNVLYNIAFESAPGSRAHPSSASKTVDLRRLGFESTDNPLKDFIDCPPGLLCFDMMSYFAKSHQDQYIKIILENFGRDDEYECPFGKCTKTLTLMLCELLHIGESLSDTNENFYPMFFSTDNVFEELYCICIQLLNKTWKEMRATVHDFSRVVSVVKEQITRVLNEKPESIDHFKTKALGLSYSQILKLIQQEFQERNVLDSQTRPVVELREHITPTIKELVRQQRLAQLVDGQSFSRFSTRGKQKEKYWYCRLSPNHRFLHYGDAEENTSPPLEALPDKLPISEVTELLTGKSCPHIKEGRLKKGLAQTAFSLLHNQEEHLDFIAPNSQVFSVWLDGLSSLLGKNMPSKESRDDLEVLLNMEMRLLLLDVENVSIPDNEPTEPPPPSDYEFCYKYD